MILENENAKALINESDRYENTPLHVAAMNGYASVVQVRLSSVSSQTLTDIYLHFGLSSLSFLYYNYYLKKLSYLVSVVSAG